jgi:hypothetical protein
MKEILKKLNGKIAKLPQSCFFNEPADPEAIAALEEKYAIKLPPSYKEFLQLHNGGFISLYEVEAKDELGDAAWNSNYIFGLGEIDEAFTSINCKTDGMDVKYIPMMHTADGEYLGFRHPLEEGDSAVYDLWHEAPAAEWADSVLYKNFHELLKEYLARDGEIETIG